MTTFNQEVALHLQHTPVHVFPRIVEKLFALISPDLLHKMLQVHKKQVDIPSNDYKTIIPSVGFASTLIETESIIIEWKNIDDFIVTADGVLHGEFDPMTINKDEFKK